MKFVVKLFPEIIVKSRSVRIHQLKRLKSNIRLLLKEIWPAVRVGGNWDILEVDAGSECTPSVAAALSDALTRIPGIDNFTEALEYSLGDFDTIAAQTCAAVGADLAGKSFCVRVKRSGNHDFRSVDLERFVGGALLQAVPGSRVDLHRPEQLVTLEIRHDRLFIVSNRRAGMGGYPLGTQDSVATLISGGYDSSVAAWQMMRRGVCSHFIFFNLGGAEHERGVKEIAYHLWHRFGASHGVTFVAVPFEAVVEEILTKVDDSHMGVVLKRQMLRAADRVAAQLNTTALVTGEAIAQVSSQTLANLQVIDQCVQRMVLRPLITMDKQSIIDQARSIGVASFSDVMPEFCGVISRKPTTKARPHVVAMQEENLDPDLLWQATLNAQYTPIAALAEELSAGRGLRLPDGDPANIGAIILDVRHPSEQDFQTLEAPGFSVVSMPFYRVQTDFPALDQSKEYWLYCPKGVMSQLQGLQLRDAGFANVKACPASVVSVQ